MGKWVERARRIRVLVTVLIAIMTGMVAATILLDQLPSSSSVCPVGQQIYTEERSRVEYSEFHDSRREALQVAYLEAKKHENLERAEAELGYSINASFCEVRPRFCEPSFEPEGLDEIFLVLRLERTGEWHRERDAQFSVAKKSKSAALESDFDENKFSVTEEIKAEDFSAQLGFIIPRWQDQPQALLKICSYTNRDVQRLKAVAMSIWIVMVILIPAFFFVSSKMIVKLSRWLWVVED